MLAEKIRMIANQKANLENTIQFVINIYFFTVMF